MAEAVFGASKLLHAVLEKYNGASLGIPSLCTQADWDDSHQQLLDRLADDIQQLRSHEEKLLQATSKLNEFKNSRTVQINTLPDDILTTIFLLVHEHWPCAVAHYSPLASNIAFPKSPKTLSHVCSRWRRVTIHLQNLWSHIDLALGDPRRRGLLDRAETYAARAGTLPLHIHVIYPDYAPEWAQFSPFVIKFFRSVTTRITSLDVFLSHTRRETNPTRDLQARVLSPRLQLIPPEILTKLTIANAGWRLQIPHRHLENLWEAVPVLRLNGVFPCWTSKAYHHLVELHLGAHKGTPVTLPESHLVEILKSSPKLRAIHLGVPVAETVGLPEDNRVPPVRLECLEILSIRSKVFDKVVRWFAPGPLPIQLSIDTDSLTSGFEVNAISGFLSRSNAVALRISTSEIPYQEVANVLRRQPDLQLLVLERCSVELDTYYNTSVLSRGYYHGSPARPCGLVYLHYCRTDFDGPRWIDEQKLA